MEVERLKQEYPDVEIRWVPFLLDPTIPPEGRTRAPTTTADTPPSHLELRGEASGILFRRGRTFTPNSMLALELNEYSYAFDIDHNALHRALFKAHFDEHVNIGDIDVLVRIGAEHGLDASDLRDALETRRLQPEVEAGIEWSRAIGVTGIPTFIFNERYAIVGAQEYPAFQNVMQRLEEESRGEG